MLKQIKKWEIIGLFVISGFGTTLHFWFAWTDYWRPVARFTAMNETHGEHFKMAFWPAPPFVLVEYRWIRPWAVTL